MTNLDDISAALASQAKEHGMYLGRCSDADNTPYALVNAEGHHALTIPNKLFAAVSALNAEDAAEVILWIFREKERARDQSYKFGLHAGRDEICHTVHKLLGIDRLVDAVERSGAPL
jgi:hypothetical protein